MTRRPCPHCGASLRTAATRCSPCGRTFRATELSAEHKTALFAEIERVADELGWMERSGVRWRRVLNEAWVAVPLAAGFIFGTLSSLTRVSALPLEDLRRQLSDLALFGPDSVPVAISISVILAVIGWFISNHRAVEVEVEEILVDYHPAIVVEKSLVRYFPFLPVRPTVVLELAGGEQIAYGSERRCYESAVAGQSGLALIASNRLLDFLTLDDA